MQPADQPDPGTGRAVGAAAVRRESGSTEYGIRQQVGARLDTSHTPLAQEAVLEHLAQAQKLALEASNLTRFQATRPLAEDMTGSHVAFLLDVGLRGRATPLHKILTTLVDCECLSLIAARLRPQRLRRPPEADRLSKWLSSV